MADTLTTSGELDIGAEYTDPDTGATKQGYIKIINPKSSGLTESVVKAAIKPALDSGIFVDEFGNTISETQIFTAYTTKQSITDYDIGYID